MNKLKHILSKYKYSLSLALLLFLVLTIFLNNHINILFSATNILLIISVLFLFSKVKNKIIRAILLSISSLILSLGIFFAISFSSPLAIDNIAAIFETNLAKALSLGSISYAMAFFCLLLTTMLLFKATSELKDLLSTKQSLALAFSLLLFINIMAVTIPYFRNPMFIEAYKQDFTELPLQTTYTFSFQRAPLLYGDALGLIAYGFEKYDFWKYRNFEKLDPSGISGGGRIEGYDSYVREPAPTIYLVIGESAYRKRMSLYGYEKPTTPFLDSLSQVDYNESPLTLYYHDGISIANTTRDALRFSLSFGTPRGFIAFWTEKNIIDLAKDAGYSTTWLSNQGRAGLYDNYPSYIARSSDNVYFETKLKKEDFDLLALLDTYHQQGDIRQLLVMHLMGSHFPFDIRSDEQDDHFNNDYDKSIHHTDRFLQQLYYYAEERDKNFMIVYYSDHGASPEIGVYGSKNTSISEYEIPLLIIDHTALSISVGGILNRYTDEATNTINNLSMVYILAELMAYSVDHWSVNSVVEQGQSVMLVDGTLVEYSSFPTEWEY